MAEQATHRTPPATASATPGLGVVAAAGVCLVAYSYLAALWPSRHGFTPDVVLLVRTWVNKPTGMGEDFGFLGTALLLMAAGYALTGALYQGRLVRALRTAAPPLVVAAVVGAVLWLLGLEPLLDTAVTGPVVAVALFTGLTAAVVPLMRRVAGLGAFVLVEIACVVALAGSWLSGGPDAARLVGTAATFVPLLALGQLSWLFRAGRLPAAHGVGLGLLFVALMVPADLLFPELVGYWHPLGSVVALLVFLISLPRGADAATTGPVRWLAARAWPLSLSVPVVGYPALSLLEPLPFLVALPVAVGLTGLAADGLNRVAGWSA
ncbi:MAG: hypothetical protein HOY78_48305 [Saccharothrix sp.]|nr:hypothetical protein [Saccharothrix sp.]